VRAETVALRQPAPFPAIPLTLQDALEAVGVAPRVRRAGPVRSRGLVWRWFAFEATWLAAINAGASLVVFAVALTMTAAGMSFAVATELAPPIYRVLNDGLPWSALALFAVAVLKAGHAALDAKAPRSTRIAGYVLALALAGAGLWIEIMLGYASVVPWMLKPAVWLAGGETAARVAAVNAAAVSYFEPVLAGAAALLLAAKQIKTGATRRAPLGRKRIAFGGAVLSLIALILCVSAAWRHHTGADAREGLSFAIGGETLSGRDSAYGSLFAPGVPCHVSSLFGWRTDPLDATQTKLHQGVDIAVKAGTPVRAIADGRVLFADADDGLGNFVALQTRGPAVVNGHMETLLVRAGQEVHRGDVIGLAGSTGKSTGPHVHLQLCPGGHMRDGHFLCGGATNPYENWPALSALAAMSCVGGPRTF
jgi:murein DD-endopeptidase MepM/ murein hydrolase activator NlpD